MVLELKRARPVWQIMFSTHHTDVGLMYLIFSILAMFIGGAMAIAPVSYTHLTLPTILLV